MLLIDLGNSFIKWGIKENTDLTFGNAFPHKVDSLDQSIEEFWGRLKKPDRVVIANVAGVELGAKLNDWFIRKWQIKPDFVEPQIESFGVRNGYDDALQLGVDRWVGLVGLRHHYELPACLVDCGTAITLDFLDLDGVHGGGLIMPGLPLMERSLLEGTYGIETFDGETGQCLGKNTTEGIANGIRCAAAGFVELGFRDLIPKCKSQLNLILTGGDGQAIAERVSVSSVYDPRLIVKGLAVVAG